LKIAFDVVEAQEKTEEGFLQFKKDEKDNKQKTKR